MCPGRLAATKVQWEVCAPSASTGIDDRRGGPGKQRGEAMTDAIEWFAGLDWASEMHRVHLHDRTGRNAGELDVPHGGEGLTRLCDWLVEKTGAEPAQIAVAIEMPRGPLVEILLERGFQAYAINPKQLDRFRDRFSPAGAKDDSRDADVLADSLRTDTKAFRRLAVDDPLVIELREWSHIAEELQQERIRLANRVRHQLWRYYPQALQLTEDHGADWFLALWQLAPTPAKAAKLHKETIARHLATHRIRRLDAAEVVRILRAPPLTVAPGTTEAASAHIRTLAPRLKVVNDQLKAAQHKLDELAALIVPPTPQPSAPAGEPHEPGQSYEQRDGAILRSMPGLGRIVLATLLGEASQLLQRRDYHSLRCLGGAAPVTRRSGKMRLVIRRYACNWRLANALYHWARGAMQREPRWRARYGALRARGCSHGRALRSIADQLLALLCALLSRQELYDPHHATRTPQPAGP